jgi:hypothetical protein
MIDVFLSIMYGWQARPVGARGHKVTHIGSDLNIGAPSEA